MMKNTFDVLLIHQPLETPKGNFHNSHPIGFFSIADTLEKNGLRVQIVNIAVEKTLNRAFSIIDYILNTRPVVIGIDLHWYIHLYNTIKLAEQIKKVSTAKIVFGGYTASIYAKDLLDSFPTIDAVIDGEGEIPLTLLTNKVIKGDNNWEEVPNLVFRNPQGAALKSLRHYQANEDDLNNFNYANIELLRNFRTYFNIAAASPLATCYPSPETLDSIILLSTGRGCKNNCFSCGASRETLRETNFPTQIRYRDPHVVTGEIKKFLGLKYRNFAIVYNPEDNFSYYLQLFEMIRKEGIKIGLVFDAWFTPPQDFIDSFAATFNLSHSALGLTLESGSLRIRKQIGKINYTNEEILSSVKIINAQGIFTNIHFTVGLPHETKQDIADTQQLMRSLKNIYGNIIISAIPIEPGSPMQVYPEKFNLTIYRKTLDDYLDFTKDMAGLKYPMHPLGYSTDQFSEMSLQKIKLRFFLQCYMNWRYVLTFLKINKNRIRFLDNLLSCFGLILRSPKLFYKYTPGSLC